jgi:N-acyl homoserine lactone hydrolase
MPAHVIHPIPLVIRGRPMSDSVFRMSGALGPVSVIGVFVWYIEGPKEKILVDAGMTWELYQKSGASGHTHVQTLKEGLSKYGLVPEDIDIIIQTHLHIDHRALADQFTKARFVIQQAELDYQRNPSPAPVDPAPCPREVLDKLKWEPVNGDTRIAEGVRTLFTPGHTPGGQSVAVETAKGLAIIDGLCTTYSNWDVPPNMQKKFEVFCPGIHSDPMQAYESLIRIKKTADIRVPLHEVRFAFIDKIPE